MEINTALFYVFSGVLLFAAFRVITARSPVYAALYLVLAFFNAACVWMLLRSEFLAIALVLVYVGAVMVLFLFVVMMLDIDVAPLREGFVRYLPIRLIVAVAMLFEICMLIGVKVLVQTPLAADAAASANFSRPDDGTARASSGVRHARTDSCRSAAVRSWRYRLRPDARRRRRSQRDRAGDG